jgi:pimeloyl-ACP methyl ester carboxylesterase
LAIFCRLKTMSFKRHVIFIDGYDPKGGRRMYAKQRVELERYAKLHGIKIEQSELDNQPLIQSWRLDHPAAKAQTQFDLLRWDDLVRQRWARNTASLTAESLASLWEFSRSAQMLAMAKLSRPMVYAALLPYALALLAMAVPLVAGWLTSALLQWVGAGYAISLVCGISVVALLAWLAHRRLRNLPSTWFLRVVAFARHYAHEADAKLTEGSYRHRIAQWADLLQARLQTSNADEILLVGYSGGSILSTGLAAALLEKLPTEQRSKLALLTLGNCIPVTACLPTAHAVRLDLQRIAQSALPWLDITSPTDWGSIHGVDCPARYAGMRTSPSRRSLSPRFHTLFAPEAYAALQRNKYQVHQQYLCTSDLLGEDLQAYDYFALIAGTLSLSQRYGLSPDSSALIT